jgi:hypothetical protein
MPDRVQPMPIASGCNSVGAAEPSSGQADGSDISA